MANSGASSFWTLVKLAADVAVVVFASMFLLGWSYLYGYYTGFGISGNEISFSVQTIPVYTLPVVKSIIPFLTVVFLVGLHFLIDRSPLQRFWASKPVFYIFVLFSIPFLSTQASSIGRQRAAADIHEDTSTLPYATLLLKDDVDDRTDCRLRGGELKLLTRMNGIMYVFLPIKGEIKEAGNFRVCMIPEERVQTVTLQVAIPEVK